MKIINDTPKGYRREKLVLNYLAIILQLIAIALILLTRR